MNAIAAFDAKCSPRVDSTSAKRLPKDPKHTVSCGQMKLNRFRSGTSYVDPQGVDTNSINFNLHYRVMVVSTVHVLKLLVPVWMSR